MDYSSFEDIKSISFGIYTNEEIRKLGVIEITNTEILDSLGHPTPGGLHDLHLGPSERDDSCSTCGLNYQQCPGHPGYITFPVPIFNPVFFNQLYQILKGSCLECHRLVAPLVEQQLVLYQLQALDYGLVHLVQELAEGLIDQDEKVSKSDAASVMINKLKLKFEEAMINVNDDDLEKPVKSVVEYKKKIVRKFISEEMMKSDKKCPNCKASRTKISRYNMRIVYVDSKRAQSGVEHDQQTSELRNKDILPNDAKQHLRLLWKNDKIFLQNLFKNLNQEEDLSIDMFFMDVIMVPPSKFRRLNVMKGNKYADAQTIMFNEVLKDCQAIRYILSSRKKLPLNESEKDIVNKLPGNTTEDKFNKMYLQLQQHVNEIFDSDTNKTRASSSKGIKQMIEKKEGIFRMNMMGKRTNYCARTVISPDPYISVNEIGIPMVFAKKLTFPEPVNQANFEKLRLAVKNGPNIHPGATLVEYEDGRIVRLTDGDPARRQAIANTLLTPLASSTLKKRGKVKIVHRHLRDGDMLLLNRQPTLHKPSIMAHKARVLLGEKTFRLHYSNCKSYNADFDGDEMNAHFPQTYEGQSECRYLANVNHQYLVPKDGTPLSGLIQDHIIAGTLLTMRGRFFTKDDYQQLLYSALSFSPKSVKLLPPTILKPETLWSGKQIVSSILINLVPEGKSLPTLEGKAKVSSKNWKNTPTRTWAAGGTPLVGDSMSESEVVIRSGELLCGVIDKAHVGPTPYSLIHLCYELYGGEVSSTILTSLARLFTHYLQYHSGFSLGCEDIMVTKRANKQRRRILKNSPLKGLEATAKALEVENPEQPNLEALLKKYKDAHFNRDDFQLKMLDMEMKKVTQELNNDVTDVCMPNGLIKKFPSNNLQLMIESGAKGTSVNAMQISCLLGQIELEGRRMPLMINGATLPSFSPYYTSPDAGGFVSGRFLTGVNNTEFFFHCIAGREGLIDTAVKTSRSGYLQRCLIKHLEGISVNYDFTVRDSDGTVIQFLYGEDGLDVSKMQMLKENSLHLLAQNYDAAVNEDHIRMLKERVDADLPKMKKQIKRWKKKHPETLTRSSLIRNLPEVKSSSVLDRLRYLNEAKNYIDENTLKKYSKSNRKCPDPVVAHHCHAFGSVSESLDEIISNYMDRHLDNFSVTASPKKSLSSEKFQNMCYYRASRSLAEPGENVGLLAAQSIGEPSTQMTLNTFHFAGKGEMNVTLGIPRIREILMTASPNIATPTMDLPLLNKPGIEEKAEKLKLRLNPVSLKAVMDSIEVRAYVSAHSNMNMSFQNYLIRFNFLKYSEYKGFLYTSPYKILDYIEQVFVKKLINAYKIKKKQRKNGESKLIDCQKESSGAFGRFNKGDDDNTMESAHASVEPAADEGDSSADEGEGDGDTTSAKAKMRHDQDQGYEDPEEEEMIPEESEDEAEKDQSVDIKEEVLSDTEEQVAVYSVPKHTVRNNRNAIGDEEKRKRINCVKCIDICVAGYDFDTKHQRWCEILLQLPLDPNEVDWKTLLEEEVGKALVHSVQGIKEALLVKNPDLKSGYNMMLKTNGVNFLEIFNHVDILDIDKIYSNNIHAIAEFYGIEAAAKAIKKEIVNVFKPYGIAVDPRHLSLISDYMTSSGFYRPCNRIGIEGSASPLQQMTFETTKNFLVDAMVMGVEERLRGPSANIFVGQLCGGGTGSFDLFTPMKTRS